MSLPGSSITPPVVRGMVQLDPKIDCGPWSTASPTPRITVAPADAAWVSAFWCRTHQAIV
jgi:hypothetical protein